MENEEVSQDATGVITGGDTTVSPPAPQPVQVEASEQAAPEIVVPEAVIPSEQIVLETPETVSQPEAQPETQPDVALTFPEPVSVPLPQSVQTVEPAVQQPIVNNNTNKNFISELLLKARAKIQLKKRLKLEKIMGLFAKKPQITNDQVEKVLHVSDSTATRYLDQLEKENKIKQNGKTGKGVVYTKN